MLTELQKLAFTIQKLSYFFLPSLPITWNPKNCEYTRAKYPWVSWISFTIMVIDIVLLTVASFCVPIINFLVLRKPNLSLENAAMILAAVMALLASLSCAIIFWKNHHVRYYINLLLIFQQKLEHSKENGIFIMYFIYFK